MSELLFDKWVIISFVIIVLIITITSDIDLNASYALLENITFYWMLFSIFNVKEYSIKNYFNQISVVITHFNSLIFPLFGLLSNSFLIKCATIIVTCVIIIIFFVCKKDTNLSRKLFCFKIQAFSKYMLWASAYL